jgi:hypothetical protein
MLNPTYVRPRLIGRVSKSGVVVPGQPGSQILLAHQKYWLPITNRSLMNSSCKSFGVYARLTTDVWQVLVRSCEAHVPGARTTNFRNPDWLTFKFQSRQVVNMVALMNLLRPSAATIWYDKMR